ncbi:MAG: EAL domain-containing protein, partial [Acidimicrobiia bacterium]|nr:EAL domain-containing protein [Acidimicrobiia bacterium]
MLAIMAGLWAVQLLLGFALPDAPPLTPAPFAWPILAIVFAVATSAVIHVHFKQESESFDLFDVPVVIGLMMFGPRELWIAQMAGTFIAVALIRRQPTVKVLFNLGLLGMQTVITAHLFRLAVTSPNPSDPSVWGPTFIAIMFGSLLNVGFIVAVVSIIEGRLDDENLLHVFTYGGVVTLTNTGLGLIATVLISVEVALVLPLVIPVTALFLAYRAYGAERDQRARLEMLYRSTRSVTELGERKDGVERLLRETSEMFRARAVDFILLAGSHGRPRRSSIMDETVQEVLHPIDTGPVDELMTQRPSFPKLIHSDELSAWGRYLKDRGMSAAMVSRVGDERNDSGVLIVGDRRGDVASFGSEDLRMMGTIVNNLAIAIERERLSERVAELRRLEQSLSLAARSDALTGLLNRSGFEEFVDEHRDRLAVAFIDLDDFKEVNDSHGHEAGDVVLATVAERIQAVVRDGDVVARLGGDEFAVIFCETQQPAKVMPRLLEQLTNPIAIGFKQSVVVGASIGLAVRREDESTSQTLRNADMAMFAAKAMGKKTWQIFSDEMSPDHRPTMDQELRDGVHNNRFDLHYQPIVDLATGRTVGFESLLRWRSDQQGLLMPGEFLQDAQDSGAIIPIEQWAMRRAAEDLCMFEEHYPPALNGGVPVFATLNISAEHLRRRSAVETLLTTTDDVGLSPSRLILEVSESELMMASASLSRTLQVLRDLGFRIAIDDFGSGDASLGVIKRNEVDAVKISRKVISGLRGG